MGDAMGHGAMGEAMGGDERDEAMRAGDTDPAPPFPHAPGRKVPPAFPVVVEGRELAEARTLGQRAHALGALQHSVYDFLLRQEAELRRDWEAWWRAFRDARGIPPDLHMLLNDDTVTLDERRAAAEPPADEPQRVRAD
jgi:hypothetical protein